MSMYEHSEYISYNPELERAIQRRITIDECLKKGEIMKITMSTEKWNKCGQPTINRDWYMISHGKKIWFHIIEQGWTKTGVYLKLCRKKTNNF